MKKVIFFSVIIAGVVAVAAFKKKAPFTPVAVIELFTSQGCSSCPSADRLLSQTISKAKKKNKKIFALSFHVDYWNRLGWSDPFSAKEYSQRQKDYAAALKLSSVYTPQMIVNGNIELVGSDEPQLKNALSTSMDMAPAASFKMLTAAGAIPTVKFTLDGDYAGCNINFALVSLSETTMVQRGENGGLTLTNENVVRQFISVPATPAGEISFKNSPLPSGNNRAIIAYIQRQAGMKIIGAAMTEIN